MDNSVLLYSGGMDSFIAAALIKPDVCLYLDTGACYSVKEISALPEPIHGRLQIDSRLDLSDWEREDLIVPNRNTLLVMIAAEYGRTIYLAATSGDRSTDKDGKWAVLCRHLLNHVYQPQHWTTGVEHEIVLTFKQHSKRQLVEMYLSAGHPAELLTPLISCYHPTIDHCGECKACARQWVAYELNGIPFPGYMMEPWTYFNAGMWARIQKRTYRGMPEDLDIERALTNIGYTPRG